jgi:hypothetical protein
LESGNSIDDFELRVGEIMRDENRRRIFGHSICDFCRYELV